VRSAFAALVAGAMGIAAAPAAADFSQEELAAFAQEVYVKASNTEADDATPDRFGSSVAVSGNTMVVGAPGEDSDARGVNGNQNDNDALGSGAAYVFVRSGTTWSQQAYLKASNADPGDGFGIGVAISGDTIVVGAFTEDSGATGVDGNQADNSVMASGAAYVFVRSGTTWTQQAYLKASNTGFGDLFGSSVGVSGDTIVVGSFNEGNIDDDLSATGAAYVFARSGTTWSEQALLRASNAEAEDQFGWSVAIAADTIVVGARQEDSAATGVNGDQGDNSLETAGAAYVFVRSGSTWSQQAYLKASNTAASDPLGAGFGAAVAIAGNTIVAGAIAESSNATGVNGNQLDNSALFAGAVYVFVRSGTTWSQQAYLKASNTDAGDSFGWSLGISGDFLVVGAISERSRATGVDGNQLDDSVRSGAAYVFARVGATWSQQAYLKASNTEQPPSAALPGDNFGNSVAISGDTLVVGADREDSNATGINGNQANNAATDTGAAYVFRFAAAADPPPPPGAWLTTPALPGFRFKVLIDGDRAGTQVADCVPQTLCIAGAIPTRAELFVRIIGPRPNGKLWAQAVRFTVSQVELWIEQTGAGNVNYYQLPALPASTDVLTGVNDSQAFDPSGLASDRVSRSATGSGVVYDFPLEKVDPAPPAGPWLVTPALPGFRFKILIDGDRTGSQVADCVPQTLCIAGAIPTRAELFVRIIGPRPNGKLWAQAVRFTVSLVELWTEQTGSGQVNYYRLDALPASTDTLPGVNDSLAFDP
jgi:hypothetical protein